jgi:hypothetical protein
LTPQIINSLPEELQTVELPDGFTESTIKSHVNPSVYLRGMLLINSGMGVTTMISVLHWTLINPGNEMSSIFQIPMIK